jgi:hypothetical protein
VLGDRVLGDRVLGDRVLGDRVLGVILGTEREQVTEECVMRSVMVGTDSKYC